MLKALLSKAFKTPQLPIALMIGFVGNHKIADDLQSNAIVANRFDDWICGKRAVVATYFTRRDRCQSF